MLKVISAALLIKTTIVDIREASVKADLGVAQILKFDSLAGCQSDENYEFSQPSLKF